MRAGTLVLIRWEDACGAPPGWDSATEPLPLVMCTSVGFLVEETEDRVTLIPNVTDDGDGDAKQSVPRSCIKQFCVLTPGPARKWPAWRRPRGKK